MPSLIVPANAEGMPKFSRAQVMRAAWMTYRRRYGFLCLGFSREEFRSALREAWREARKALAKAVALARMTVAEIADRVAMLSFELMRIDARPWGMSIADDRAEVLAEITGLEAERDRRG